MMQTARIFTNGNSQAVRLPKEFRFDDDEVIIKKVGNAVILLPKRYAYADLKPCSTRLAPWNWSVANPKRTRSGISAKHGPARY
jgi:virulence-associated protein VagC